MRSSDAHVGLVISIGRHLSHTLKKKNLHAQAGDQTGDPSINIKVAWYRKAVQMYDIPNLYPVTNIYPEEFASNLVNGRELRRTMSLGQRSRSQSALHLYA